MNREVNKVFIEESIRLDYTTWDGCVFQHCEIIAVTGDFDLINCDFQNCNLKLSGLAGNIAKLMYIFYPDKIPLIFPPDMPSPLAGLPDVEKDENEPK